MIDPARTLFTRDGARWAATLVPDEDQQPFPDDLDGGTESPLYQGWLNGDWAYANLTVGPVMTEPGDFEVTGGPYEVGTVTRSGLEGQVQVTLALLVTDHGGRLADQSLDLMRATHAALGRYLAAVEGPGPEPWCNHDRPAIRPDGRCECGELVACPECATGGLITRLTGEDGQEVRPGYAGTRACPVCEWRGVVAPVTDQESHQRAWAVGRPYWTEAAGTPQN